MMQLPKKIRSLIVFVSDISEYTSEVIDKLKKLKVPISYYYGSSAKYYASLDENSKEINDKKQLIKILSNQSEDNSFIGLNGGINWILDGEILSRLPTLNIHPSLLPLNRGSHHSFWSIMNDENHGATLHWMDEGIDTGPIISQKSFINDGRSTAGIIQKKSEKLCIELLGESILNILSSIELPKGKNQIEGTSHLKKEIIEATSLDINESIKVSYFLKLCRATCSKNNGIYITNNGENVAKIIVKEII
jgi:methionyl-tRNA formyltransferase